MNRPLAAITSLAAVTAAGLTVAASVPAAPALVTIGPLHVSGVHSDGAMTATTSCSRACTLNALAIYSDRRADDPVIVQRPAARTLAAHHSTTWHFTLSKHDLAELDSGAQVHARISVAAQAGSAQVRVHTPEKIAFVAP